MLTVQDLSHFYAEQQILFSISLTCEPGEILGILGPSGCGKTTLLRAIAGLETVHSGNVKLFGQDITPMPVHEREIGFMFQDYALFPHMDVVSNVAFGLRIRRVPHTERQARVEEILKLVNLQGFEHRAVDELSGGERQRVALARCLAPYPRLLMLDEPMGSLDAALKAGLSVELRDIIKRAGTATLYVTHDRTEAFSIADRIAIMRAGKIEQVAPPQELYLQPATTFVAEFLGLMNIFPGELWPGLAGSSPLEPESRSAYILLHPEYLSLSPTLNRDNPELLSLEGYLTNIHYLGERFRLIVTTSVQGQLLSLMCYHPVTSPLPSVGQSVRLLYPRTKIIPLVSSHTPEYSTF